MSDQNEKKLYRVEVSFVVYAYSKNENTCISELHETLRDIDPTDADYFLTEVKYRDTELAEGWDGQCRPYPSYAVGPISEILAKLPTRAEAAEAEDTHDEASQATPRPWGAEAEE